MTVYFLCKPELVTTNCSRHKRKVHFDKRLGCQATNASAQKLLKIFFELNFYKQSGVTGSSSRSCLLAVPSDEPNINDTPGLLLITRNPTDATFLCPQRITLMLAGNRVIEFLRLADTFVTLLAPTYYLDSSYRQDSANTFDLRLRRMGVEVQVTLFDQMQRRSVIICTAVSIQKMDSRCFTNH